MLWGGWAVVCAAVFSLSKGIFHPYYTVQLAPGLAALAGAGGVALWQLGRRHHGLMWVLPAVVVATAALAVDILHRSPTYHPWLRRRHRRRRRPGGRGPVGRPPLAGQAASSPPPVVIAAITLLAGPGAYALDHCRPRLGRIDRLRRASHRGRDGWLRGHRGGGGPADSGRPADSARRRDRGAGGSGGGRRPGRPRPPAGRRRAFAAGRGAGGTSTVSPALISYLEAHRNGAQYLVAAFTSQSSAPIIIASGQPVITIGGFNGGDPAPTLSQFEQLVAQGKVRYVLVQGGGGGGGPGRGDSSITTWVTTHGTLVPASSYGDTTGSGSLYQVSAG